MLLKRFSICSMCAVLMVCGLSERVESKTRKPSKYHFERLADTGYQVIFDVENTEFDIFSGNWILSKTGSYLYSYYYTISGPGTGSSKARWTAEGLPNGNYLVEFYCDNANYPQDARYQLIASDGVHDLSVNMNYVGAGWHTLGTFPVDRVCVVNISDYWTGAGNTLAVDALRFTYQGTVPPPPTTTIPPHIGVCIDDCGSVNPTQSTQPIYQMLRLPFSMTYAIMPSRSYSTQTDAEVHARGSEVVLHQPMAAISVSDPGAGGITDAMTLAQIRTTVSNNLDSLPHCIGMNNHMGSLITQQSEKMQVCVEELKTRRMYFYDSRTITTTVAYDVAKVNGLLTAERDLFLDGSNKDEAKNLIRNLANRALNAPNVSHCGIGHVRADTATAFQEMVPELEAMGVTVWPISRCLAQVVEADNAPDGASVSSTGNWVDDSDDCYSKQLQDGNAMIISNPAASKTDTFTFRPWLQWGGDYDIYAVWKKSSSNANPIKARISSKYGNVEKTIDQSEDYGDWRYLGRFACNAGSYNSVTFRDSECVQSGQVFRADAVRFNYAGPSAVSAVDLWSKY